MEHLSKLVEQRLELERKINALKVELDEINSHIATSMRLNDVERYETPYHTIGLKKTTSVSYIGDESESKAKKITMAYLDKKGLTAKFMVEQFSAPKFKKYLEESGDDCEGTIELSTKYTPDIRAKSSIKEVAQEVPWEE